MSLNTIGIDAGGSLIKIAYEEDGRIHLRKYPIGELEQAINWLKWIAANKKVVLTGGKAEAVKANYYHNAEIINEFTAVCEGAKYLMQKEKISLDKKILLVNIGTGTSWFTIEGENYNRVLGSGIGGGTFMGLGSLLDGPRGFSDLVNMAFKGDRANVDLLVKDIYDQGEPPIPADLTASNFAKAATGYESSVADGIASAINMISETITLLTMQAAAIHKTNKVIFIGSTLAGNSPLQESLSAYSKMSGLESSLLRDGEFSGAIGAKIG
jgi:type II pantothenate kinase